jgi:hypothetical protein
VIGYPFSHFRWGTTAAPPITAGFRTWLGFWLGGFGVGGGGAPPVTVSDWITRQRRRRR